MRDAAMIAPMYDAAERTELAHELTGAFLAGPWKADLIAESGAACLDRWPSWMTALAIRVAVVHRTPPVNRRGELFALIVTFLEERRAPDDEREPPRVLRVLADAPSLRPADRPRLQHEWAIAAIGSVGELAERLELSDGQLAWLADVRGLERTVTAERLRNYRYRALPRPGGVPRVIEAPKARLKEIQRWILREILDQVPPHAAAHGFTRHRSAVTHAQLHTGQAAVLRLDLKDFFASVPVGRVYGIFRTLGYSRSVCHVLAGLTTNTVPESIWQVIAGTTHPHAVQARFWLGRQLATPHLPQGAPTSPALANLAAFRLDQRLSGLAVASGLRYSRYADDLTFSGPARLHRRRNQFELLATRIVAAEGFTVNEAKSTTQSAGGRQTVCGIVVNVHPNLRRSEYERLKATLHNAAVHGHTSQNHEGVADFRAHLRGRIAWVRSLNPARGDKLGELLAQIDWS
ncbi:MAG: reverse transcriptase family protein [Solirubrobacteraceae bacterium]